MEKLSLYDFLSVLLPGSLLTLFLLFFVRDLGVDFKQIELNQYFSLMVFLSFSIFLGSIINILTRSLLDKPYKAIGLYEPISKIYSKFSKGKLLEPYYEEMMNKLSPEKDFDEKIEDVWAKIYYTLEANNKIAVPKSFQSFYFFFRNFFTLGLLLLIPAVIMLCYYQFNYYLYTLILTILIMVLSIFSAKWNRKKMVERMFWTYYVLYGEKS